LLAMSDSFVRLCCANRTYVNYWEHLIRDDADYQRHMDYVHVNPLKHVLVKRVSDWPHSTFHRYEAKGIYSGDWCGEVNDVIAGDE
jgi:putative transposase